MRPNLAVYVSSEPWYSGWFHIAHVVDTSYELNDRTQETGTLCEWHRRGNYLDDAQMATLSCALAQ